MGPPKNHRLAKSRPADTLRVIDNSAQDLTIENQALAIQP